jgi:hypothetical protein
MTHLRHLGWVIPLLLASACGGDRDPTAGKTDEQLRREIEAVATPKPLAKDLPPPFRLGPLKVGEVREYIGGAPGCMLVFKDRIFFATRGPDGIARIDGRLVQLTASGPVGATGGFFTAEGATISIGRVAQYAGAAEAYVPGWAVDVAVGGAAQIRPQEFQASWTCRRRFEPEQVRPLSAGPT